MTEAPKDQPLIKRFVLFSGNEDARGGWDDFGGDYLTLTQARVAFARGTHDWAHVLDCECTEVVARWYKGPNGTIHEADRPMARP
jgi:hypothetical protein